MTTQNNAAQPVLTDDEIRTIITDAHQSHGAFKTGYGLSLGRAIETAVLSKLRAPVPDGKRPDLDWIEGVRVTDTVGRGWCVRIDGTDIFEDANRYGCKGRKSFQIASGLSNKQEAERAALEWLDRQRAALASAPVADERAASQIAKWKRSSELLDAVQDGCWDVRFLSSTNGDAGDSSIGIEIVAHFMAAPRERVIGENWSENLRAALEQAMTADTYPPARPERASAPVAGEAQPDDLNKRLLEATIRDLAAISEHLGLDPNEGGADPIIEAIDELRRERDDWVDAQYAAAGDASPQASSVAGGAAHEPSPGRFKPPFDNCSFRMCDLPGQCRGEGKCHHPVSAAPQAPAGWRWTLHPAGLHPDVYAAAAARDSAKDVRDAALEEAAAAVDDHCRAGREWIPGSLWDALSREAGARIRALKSTPAPRAAEDSEDDMLTIAYLAGAQAEKERAALSAQPGAIRNPLIAEPSGNPGELDCAALGAASPEPTP
ncbi:transcriptional regulator [Bordetella phage vB_BbrS_PHB09]|nr:transcriptional regulator [Bordetella phage vB_BbrS_PHB09]